LLGFCLNLTSIPLLQTLLRQATKLAQTSLLSRFYIILKPAQTSFGFNTFLILALAEASSPLFTFLVSLFWCLLRPAKKPISLTYMVARQCWLPLPLQT